jgi:hypothetical protein
MGEVYEAIDSALGETVALKTIAITAVDQADAVKRLLAEVRIARRVTHPNVCRILEFGTHERTGSRDGPIPFLTMPLLRGETLGQRLKQNRRLPPQDALRILKELAAGLAAVHDVGVVHRDFKSDNVFLVQGDDGSERAVVMDFGLARALERPGDGSSSTGRLLLGTPAYMAPEQVEGKTVTKAADVYALGVVGFEMITGRVPFVAASAAAVALARLQRNVVAPSSLVEGLDKGWDAVIRRCLKRSPEERFRTTTDVAAALDSLLGGARRPAAFRLALAFGVAMGAVGLWMATHRSVPARASGTPSLVSRAPGQDAKTPPVPAPAATAPSSAKTSAGAMPASDRAEQRARRSSRTRAAAPTAAPPTATPPAPQTKSAEAASPPFQPAEPRRRQPDDLVDPFGVRTEAR